MKKAIFVMLCLGLSLAAVGCSKKEREKEFQIIAMETYDKIEYPYVELVREDLKSSINLSLECENFEIVSYPAPYDEMQVKEFFVEAGEKVKAGDVLVTFLCEEYDKQLKNYEDELNILLMMKDHYEKLYAINATEEEKAKLEEIDRGINVNRMYISELRAKKDVYTIVADREGVVERANVDLMRTILSKGTELVRVFYSDQIYSGEADTKLEINEGDVLEASAAGTSFMVKFLSVEPVDEDGKLYKYYFQIDNPDQVFCKRNYMDLSIERPVQNDVIWVPINSVLNNGTNDYVYVLDENGYREVREIEINNVVDGKYVIKSGLSEGDKVVVSR